MKYILKHGDVLKWTESGRVYVYLRRINTEGLVPVSLGGGTSSKPGTVFHEQQQTSVNIDGFKLVHVGNIAKVFGVLEKHYKDK